MKGDLVFLDTETTSLDETYGDVWEIGFIRRYPTMVGFMSEPNILPYVEDEFVLQLRPDLNKADSEALRIGRYEERFLLPDGVDAAWVWADGTLERDPVHSVLFDLFGHLKDTTIYCAQPAFDVGFLKALFRSYRMRIPWHYRLKCVESMTDGKLGRNVGGLRDCADALGVKYDRDELHTALGDARLVRDVYDAIVGSAGSAGDSGTP